ncbi:uncharacterized protein PFL1_01907 [Pseudozyma flocculosa PF-1]|uniref:F-box domain-containing protein n=1 Tax=Pseudozyma flocculosa TaxID=84751 RepID=A0A5C3EYU6_9BASI|nr:uncharacterized protein PFL1_01907 [Pseudozyma flocculosa PF-1]EPQ30381.1 hypothetical protein PFL1_01907 [Pseudozyma flocculosa PF-1]SPO37454.1 uncharacterized protein PSFLO_02928 [Pseudozyma flocculosa]
MSNLLHSVLNSRLANATSPQTHDASDSDGGTASPGQEGLHDWETVESDEEIVNVVSVPHTVPGTPAELSRPSSPGPNASRLRNAIQAGSSQDDDDDDEDGTQGEGRKREKVAKRKRHSKTDPLRAFTSEISQHIFLQLPVSTLVSCSQVNRHWRRSATLNYCWYRTYQHAFSVDSLSTSQPELPPWGSGGAKWTRKESRTDWKTAYAKARRIEAREAERAESLPGSGATTPSRTQRMQERGILTAHEFRMEQWKAEQESGSTKNEMREYYKSAGNKGGKVKGKRAKGGVKTNAEGDGGLWQ